MEIAGTPIRKKYALYVWPGAVAVAENEDHARQLILMQCSNNSIDRIKTTIAQRPEHVRELPIGEIID